MAYRRPGIEVVQQFQELTPALALPTLPGVVVGPAFQIETDKSTQEVYSGSQKSYSYPDLHVGAVVDVRSLDSDEPSEIQKPVDVKLTNAYVTKASGADGTTGIGSQTYSTTSNAFANVAISPTVKYYVEIADGHADDGKHLIIAKNSNTSVELADELTLANTASSNYKVLKLEAELEYDNASFSTVGIVAASSNVTLPTNLPSDSSDVLSEPVSEADDVKITYRALRVDLADSLTVFSDLDSLEAVFGIGSVVPANPMAYGTLTALNNTTTKIKATGLRSSYYADEVAAYTTALDFLRSEDVYGMAILTQNASVHQLLSSHVTGQSVSSVGRERIGFINKKIPSKQTIVPTSGTGTEITAGTGNGTSPANSNIIVKNPTNGSYIADSVGVGDKMEISTFVAVPGVDPVRTPAAVTSTGSDSITSATKTIVMTTSGTWTGFVSADVGHGVRIASSGHGNNGDYTIVSVTNATTVVVAEAVSSDETGGSYTFELIQLAPTTAQTAYITGTRHEIASVNSNTQLTLSADPTNGFWGTLEGVSYAITDDLTVDQKASAVAGYAASFANRRLISVVGDTAIMTVGGVATLLPGYYFGCAIVGLVAGLPSQQGFTNMSLTGFTGRANSDDVFDDEQLDIIAGGGNLVISQDVDQAPVYVRHQLTTNSSSIQFRELSITKNVDLIARFFRGLYRPFIGIYNITDTLLDLLKTTSESGIDYLKNQVAPRVGGVLRDGSLSSLGEDPLQNDSVIIVLDCKIPYPLNNIRVTLVI